MKGKRMEDAVLFIALAVITWEAYAAAGWLGAAAVIGIVGTFAWCCR